MNPAGPLISPVLAFFLVGSALAQNIAPQRGGVTDGSPIIDSAGPVKGGTVSLAGDRSGCLSPQVRVVSVTVTDGYQAGSLWMANQCPTPIAYVFCSVGPADDGFNCAPNSHSVLDGEGLTVYHQGAWQLGPNQSVVTPISTKNRIVWYACDNSAEAGDPLLTSVDPPMGRCWKPAQSNTAAASPHGTPNNPPRVQEKDGTSADPLDSLLQEQMHPGAAAAEAARQSAAIRQQQPAAAPGSNAPTPIDSAACNGLVVNAAQAGAALNSYRVFDTNGWINRMDQVIAEFMNRHAPVTEVERFFSSDSQFSYVGNGEFNEPYQVALKQCVISHLSASTTGNAAAGTRSSTPDRMSQEPIKAEPSTDPLDSLLQAQVKADAAAAEAARQAAILREQQLAAQQAAQAQAMAQAQAVQDAQSADASNSDSSSAVMGFASALMGALGQRQGAGAFSAAAAAASSASRSGRCDVPPLCGSPYRADMVSCTCVPITDAPITGNKCLDPNRSHCGVQ